MSTHDSNQREPSPAPLRALILEDSPRDAKLLVEMLEREGDAVRYEVTDSQDLFRERLKQAEYDIVLADFNLRSWNAFDALEILKQSGKDVPLIVVTGSLGDEGAADCIKQGAADYVLKDRPARLPLAIKQALEEKRLREERQRTQDQLRDSEAKFRLLFAANPFPMWVYDVESLRFLEVNDAAVAYYGYTRDEFLQMQITDIRPADYVDFGAENLAQEEPTLDRSGPWRHKLKDGRIIRVQITSHTTQWEGRRAMLVVAQDVSERLRSEEALRESEERYRLLFERNLAGVFRITLYGRVLHCNQAMADMLGFDSPQEVLAHRFQDFYLTAEDHARFLRELIVPGRVSNFEMQMRRQDGSPVWVIANVSTKTEAPGDLRVMEGTLIDITERKRAEAGLKKERHLLQTLMNNLPDLVYFKDLDSRFTRINEALAKKYRLSGPAQAVGRSDFDYLATEHAKGFYEDDQEIIQTGQPVVDKEERGIWPDGHVTWVSTTKMPLRDDNGNIVGTFGVSRDITARKRAEEKLREYEKAVEGLEEMLVVVDRDYRYVLANRAFLKSRGMEGEDLIGRAVAGVLDATVFENVIKKKLDECFEGKIVRYEMKYTYPELGERDLFISYFPIEGPSGVDRVAGVLQDITERKRAEAALVAERHLLHTLMDNVPDAIYFKDLEGRFTRVNRAVAKGFGLEELGAATGKTDFDFFTEEHAQQAFADEQEIIRTGQPIVGKEEKETWADGRVKWVSTTKMPLRDPGGTITGTFGISRDITERKRAELALHESEEHFRGLFENATVGIYRTTPDGRILMANPTLVRMLGFERFEDLAERNLETDGFEPDYSRRAFREQIEREGVVKGLEAVWSKHDGPVTFIRESARAIRAEDGRVMYYDGIVEDITERRQIEDSLRKSEERFRTLIEKAPISVGIGRNGLNVYANRKYLDMFGFESVDELVGRPIGEQRAPPYRAMIEERSRRRALGLPVPSDYEGVAQRRDGTQFLVQVDVTIVNLPDGPATVAFLTDITERKRAEEALKDSEQRYRDFIEHSNEGVWRMELEQPIPMDLPAEEFLERYLRYTYVAECNLAYARGVGFSVPEEVVGKHLGDLFPPSDQERWESFRSAARRGLKEPTVEFRSRDKSGNLKHWLRTQIPIIQNGMLVRVWGITRDVTEVKRAEEALRQSEEKYRSIVLSIPHVVWTIDFHGRVTFISPNVERLSGFTPEEICKAGVAHLMARVHPDDVQKVRDAIDAVIRGEPPRGVEYRSQRKDGRWIWVRAGATGVFRKDGDGYLQGLLSDITEQKLAEAALRDSETRYRTIFESAGDAILLSKDETLVDCSARALDLFHCTRTQLIGQSVLSLSPAFQPDGSDSKQSVLETIQRVLSKGSESFEWQFQRRDGTLFYSEFRLTCLELAGEVYLLGVVRDTTEYRRAEETLVRLRQAVNASGEVVFMTDREGVFTFVNPEFTRLYGYTEAEVLGQATPRILRSGMIDAAHYARFWDTLRQKRVARGEISNKTKDGRLVSVASSVNPVLNEKGDIAAYLAIQRDVSERKRLEEQYLQAQKMEAVGRLAAGVAHDFNNLLTIINGYSDLLLERLPADDPARDSVAEIKGAGERATGLTRQLLAFSRQQIRTSRVLDLNALVATSIKMLRRLIGEDVELVFIPGGDLDMIKADPGQIEQVLMNLAVNARDAMLRGGKLTIETSNFLADQAYSSSHYPMPPGSYVMLAVSDTGQGMDAETQARIFEPFFTTKGQGKGTGLGLPTVYGIVKQSAGYTWVYSELGQGTTFKIYLPAAEGTPDAAKAIGAVAGGSETVLLVEDEAKLRSLARSVLESRGYKVLEARTSMEALLIPSQYQGPIHLLLTDVVMPALSGRELAEKLTKLHPELKILFMSGYTDDTVVRHGVLESGMAYLQKPFSPDALARKVREVLDAQKPSS